MDNQLFRDIQTDLDLNGPILSFTTQPTSLKVAGVAPGQTGGPTATFTSQAIVSFPGDPSPLNSGTIGYQWYGPNGILTEGTKYIGTKTATLQITNVTSPTDVGFYYVQLDYVPSSETGNAINEPLNSDSAELTSFPIIEINAQPTPITTIASRDNNFNIDASLSDNGTDIGYQWQLDGENVSDGTVTKSTVELIPGTTEKRVTSTISNGSLSFVNIPVGAKDVQFNVCGGAGGKGGGNFENTEGSNRVGGRGGYGMEGWFRLARNFYRPGDTNMSEGIANGITVGLFAGNKGNDGIVGSRENASGGTASDASLRGGNGGAHGWGAAGGQQSSGDAGGGGGGGGASMVTINGTVAIVAGGGGGGGGAFNNTAAVGGDGTSNQGSGQNGRDAGPVRTNSGPQNFSPSTMSWTTGTPSPSAGGGGSPGHDGQGSDTPGGGGGGAGAAGGGGGHHGHRPSGSPSGSEGGSDYDPSFAIYRSGSYNTNGNGWASVSYTVDESGVVPTSVTRTTTISGAGTNQLTLNTDGPGIGYTVRCSVNSSVSSNSPVISDEVPYQVESTVTDANLTVEGIGLDSTVANISTTNLANGELTLDTIGTGFVGSAPTIQLYSLYSPDKDLDVEMDLYGGGASDGSAGEGGFARIRFTMKQNEEYVIAGLTEIINTPFLYRKATLMACVGEAGKTAVVQNKTFGGTMFKGIGGNGGGINIAGSSGGSGPGGHSHTAAPGGIAVGIGGLSLQGVFGSAFANTPKLYPGDSIASSELYKGLTQTGSNGGRTISCTKGVYFREQGLSPCQDIIDPVLSHFRLPDGREAANTGLINRGYKSGLNYIQTAGGGGTGLRGGNGATGGHGAISETQAAGGGSGYGDGSFNIITTTQGGSRGAAKVVIRVVT